MVSYVSSSTFIVEQEGLHTSLVPKHVQIYLDNGAFKFSRSGGEVPRENYKAFVKSAKPDWYAIPQDYIPTPCMSDYKQNKCLEKTMAVNQEYSHDGYVPILHVSRTNTFVCLMKMKNFGKNQFLPLVELSRLLRAPEASLIKKYLIV